jgi:hypothetical protein
LGVVGVLLSSRWFCIQYLTVKGACRWLSLAADVVKLRVRFSGMKTFPYRRIHQEARRAGDKFNCKMGLEMNFPNCDWNDCLELLGL